jgi:hypothetical protein
MTLENCRNFLKAKKTTQIINSDKEYLISKMNMTLQIRRRICFTYLINHFGIFGIACLQYLVAIAKRSFFPLWVTSLNI